MYHLYHVIVHSIFSLILDEIIKLSKKGRGRGRGGVAKGGTRGRGVGRGRGGASNRQQPNVGGANVSLLFEFIHCLISTVLYYRLGLGVPLLLGYEPMPRAELSSCVRKPDKQSNRRGDKPQG